jgi:hypothetical protein
VHVYVVFEPRLRLKPEAEKRMEFAMEDAVDEKKMSVWKETVKQRM